MAELRRVTTAPVDWGSFSGGNILAVATGKSRRCSVRECSVLLLSASGTVLADAKLGGELGDVMDTAANTAGVVVCCVSRGSGRSRKTALAFVSGPQLLKLQELPYTSGVEETRWYSVVCLRIGCCDVAVYGLGTSQLFSCTRNGNDCRSRVLWDFGDACVRRVVSGRHANEVLVLLDDGSVAVVALPETVDGSGDCLLMHHVKVSSTGVPTHAVFAGGAVLWVLCDDNVLCGYWFPPPPVDGVEEPPVRLHSEQLALPNGADNTSSVFMVGEGRLGGLHIAIQEPTAVHLNALAVRSLDGPYQLPTVTGWSRSVFVWSGHIHSFVFKQCAYELLVQSELGASPLSVVLLRQNSGVLVFEDLPKRLLSHQVICAAPDKLEGLRDKCESAVQALEATAAKVFDLHTTEKALTQLLNLQHCLVATLHRERELNAEVQPYQSISMHLIKRLHTVYVRLSVYRLLYSSHADERLDVPLYETLGLEEAIHTNMACQAELRGQFEREFGLTPASAMEALSLWGSQDTAPVMCIDAILSHMGCSHQVTLRGVIQQITTMQPITALFVLYCTFSATQGYVPAQLDSIRGEFLDNFCLPASVNLWAYLSFAADHHVSLTSLSTAHGLGWPPLLDLVPGIINGLTYSGEYELVFQLTGCVLAVSTAHEMDASVAVKLLFLAYKRGSAAMVEALYRKARGTVWGSVATHALARAALQTENIQLLSGLVTPQSREEDIVESVLRGSPDAHTSDVVLMDFYILMQRYAEALRMCEQIASRGSAEAQQVQIIASHLRSLMPNGNESYRLRCSAAEKEPAQAPRNGPCRLLPLQQQQQQQLTTPSCPLQNEEEELEEAVARTTARICARRHDERPHDAMSGSHPREVSVLPYTPTPAASLGITRDKTRGTSGRDGSTAATQPSLQHQKQQQPELSPSVRRGEESVGTLDASLQTGPLRSVALTVAAASVEREPLYCEAILKRSKKQCGRKRPCEYHDRARK